MGTAAARVHAARRDGGVWRRGPAPRAAAAAGEAGAERRFLEDTPLPSRRAALLAGATAAAPWWLERGSTAYASALPAVIDPAAVPGGGSLRFAAPVPEPVRFPRSRLDRRFAVLLMRSTYEAVDDLDFVAMNNFQVTFWKTRREAFENYKLAAPPFETGELTDPNYFDFISYMQFDTIGRVLGQAKQVFEEQVGADGEQRVVRRDARVKDDALLPGGIATIAGDKIYAGLRYGFEDEDFGGPAPLEPKVGAGEELAAKARDLLAVFVRSGFALRGEVYDVETAPGSVRFKVRLEGPASLWGAGMSESKRLALPNDFFGFALAALCRASGVRSTHATSTTETTVEQEWRVVDA